MKIVRGNNSMRMTFYEKYMVLISMDIDILYLIKYEFLTFLPYLGQQKTLKKCNKNVFILLSKLSSKICFVTNFHLIYLSNIFF